MVAALELRELSSPKILVIRLARLGDVILLIPTLKALKRAFPRARLNVLVGHRCASVLEICSAVDEVIPVDRVGMRDGSRWCALRKIFFLAEQTRRAKYDLVLDLHGFRETNLLAVYSRARWRMGLKRFHAPYLPFCFNLQPCVEDKTQHVSRVFLSSLEKLGITVVEPDGSLDLDPADLRQAKDLLGPRQDKMKLPLVGLNLGAGSAGRMWPAERFAGLARLLIRNHGMNVILFSGPQEGRLADLVSESIPERDHVIQAPYLPMRRLAAAISLCSLLISSDTGPMHLGPAVGVPTLGLFSLGYPEHYQPLGRFSRYIKRDSMEGIQIDEVYKEAVGILSLISVPQEGILGSA